MAINIGNNSPANFRNVLDANYIVTCNLPSGAANTNTNNLNLVQATPYPVTERVICQVSTTSSASGNSINMNVALQHTSANSDGTANTAAWVNIPTLAPALIAPGASTTAATTTNFSLPSNTLQFVRALAIGVTNMGNLSDSVLTLELLF